MSIEKANIELAEKMYEYGWASDWPKLEALLTEDFEIVEAACFSFGGTYRGKKALQEVFGKVLGILQPKDVRRKSMTANDSEVVSMLELVFDDTDGDFVMPIAEHFEMRDGRIAKMVPYFLDTAAMIDYLRRRDTAE